jgi:hypothetical protein
LLRAGPLTVLYEAGDLRYLRLGEQEVLRRVYVAVRDRNWGTIPAQRTNEVIEADTNSFRITYDAEHCEGTIHFGWKAEICGEADGRITFTMTGMAHSTFLRNRIGFCILHPIRECAGARCQVEQADGTVIETRFPRAIAPANPLQDIQALAHEVSPGVWAELRFRGDLFEMEDQRNWIDASYKTFCTPLRLPFPVEIATGTSICQAAALTWRGLAAVPSSSPRSLTFVVEPRSVGRLPDLGLGLANSAAALQPWEIERLRKLHLAHLRIDLPLKEPGWETRLVKSSEAATAIGCTLEVALFLSNDAEADLKRLVRALRSWKLRVVRWLIYHEAEWSTTEPWVRLARTYLKEYNPRIPLVSGTNANFAELNRTRPPSTILDGVCYVAHPQEHAFDNRSLVENLEGLAATLQSARLFCGNLPLSVTPVTLRKRVNPYATGAPPVVGPGELPPRVDPRQMSLFGAGWTLGSLKALAENGAASATYYETTGWLGVMETEAGCPLPDRFPSIPKMVYPLYHVLADVGEFAGAEVLQAQSSTSLEVDGLVLRQSGVTRLLLANYTGEPQTVRLQGIRGAGRLVILEESNVLRAATSPETFRKETGTLLPCDPQGMDLCLGPYAVARLDGE